MNAFSFVKDMISILFFICYFYQLVYIFVPFLVKRPLRAPEGERLPGVKLRVAVLIAARNEGPVIGQLLDSISAQTYPGDLVTTFVVADNCTDDTAKIAENAGAVVYTRFNDREKGKGYALNYLLENIRRDYKDAFDAFLVLDADNLLKEDYIECMVETIDEGYEIITSYRNSKNYGDNWISSGYALWFLRESEYLNHARHLLGTSAAVSGTGFMFRRSILEACGGWQFFLLTEDIQFTVHNILSGVRIGYAKDAMLYDEQPLKFRQSWIQRERWAKGYLEVFRDYGARLVKGAISGCSFSCFDMCMNIMPAMILSVVTLLLNAAELVVRFGRGEPLAPVVIGILAGFAGMYVSLFVLGAITTVTEWRNIRASSVRKIVAVFTFPIFMFTYIPISICALFKRVEWKPIEHSVAVTINDLDAENGGNRRMIGKKSVIR